MAVFSIIGKWLFWFYYFPIYIKAPTGLFGDWNSSYLIGFIEKVIRKKKTMNLITDLIHSNYCELLKSNISPFDASESVGDIQRTMTKKKDSAIDFVHKSEGQGYLIEQ